MERLKRPGIKLFKGVRVKDFSKNEISYLWDGQVEILEALTDIVLSEKMRSDRRSAELFKKAGVEVHVIGDAKSPRTLLDALAEADELGRAL